MSEMPTVEVLKAFALAPDGKAKQVTGFTYAELLDAMSVDPDEAVVRFRALLDDPRRNAGAKACGPKFVPVLIEAFNDKSQTVQESAMWSLLKMDPSGGLLLPLMAGMRKAVVKWSEDGAFGPVRLLALLGDTEAKPFIARFIERSDIDKSDRVRAQWYFEYLTAGIEPALERIRGHTDPAQMAHLCRMVLDFGDSRTEAALEHLLGTAPDERCRLIALQALEALKVARSKGAGPYLLGTGLYYRGLPKVDAT